MAAGLVETQVPTLTDGGTYNLITSIWTTAADSGAVSMTKFKLPTFKTSEEKFFLSGGIYGYAPLVMTSDVQVHATNTLTVTLQVSNDGTHFTAGPSAITVASAVGGGAAIALAFMIPLYGFKYGRLVATPSSTLTASAVITTSIIYPKYPR